MWNHTSNVQITSSELPHGWVGLSWGINEHSQVTIEDLSQVFDKQYAPKDDTVHPGATWHTFFGGGTFNTNSKGNNNPKEIFNGWVGKTSDNYDA